MTALRPLPEVILIAAVGPDRIIGDGSRLPWALPRDMRLFRRLTTGHAVIMGRRTYQSIGAKPLPKRRNIVVTRDPDFRADRCTVVHSIEAAFAAAATERRAFVIGGGEIYGLALPFADAILLTEIFDESPNATLFESFRGDVRFPALPAQDWTELPASRRSYAAVDTVRAVAERRRTGLRFRVRRYVKADAPAARFPRLTGREVQEHLVTPRVLVVARDGDVPQADLFADPAEKGRSKIDNRHRGGRHVG